MPEPGSHLVALIAHIPAGHWRGRDQSGRDLDVREVRCGIASGEYVWIEVDFRIPCDPARHMVGADRGIVECEGRARVALDGVVQPGGTLALHASVEWSHARAEVAVGWEGERLSFGAQPRDIGMPGCRE